MKQTLSLMRGFAVIGCVVVGEALGALGGKWSGCKGIRLLGIVCGGFVASIAAGWLRRLADRVDLDAEVRASRSTDAVRSFWLPLGALGALAGMTMAALIGLVAMYTWVGVESGLDGRPTDAMGRLWFIAATVGAALGSAWGFLVARKLDGRVAGRFATPESDAPRHERDPPCMR